MKLIKNRAGWRRFLKNDVGLYPGKRGDEVSGYPEPIEFPCYAYAVVQSFAYEEQKPVILYEDDIERMLNHVRIARIEGK
ncbi:hypothetical protein PQR05_29245 [Paraburkholderia sediminicola]|uniref:hypothetical protein n=1 Tax=Paraburkholderia sediminicola TaxID=458836 RepID=UPI0038BD80A3